jgi:PAS domain S-box-containing protein
MPLGLPTAHRLARLDYAPRALAFAYTFLALWALVAERGGGHWTLFFGALQFLVYPHLAYLHACIARDSKRAELHNLLADALMLGAWAAQMQFALWPTCGILAAVCLNSASNGGLGKLARAVGLFALGAALWGAFTGYRFNPGTGPLVSLLSAVGIVMYTSFVGEILFDQNTRLLRTRDALRKSEEQFRFIAEHAGDMVAVLDSDRLFRYASASHARYFKPASYAPGQRWLDLVYPDDRAQARHFLGLIASSNTRERVHLRMLSSNGAWRIVECQGNTVWDDRQNVQMVVLILRDVEARVRTDVELQLSSGSPSAPGSTESADESAPSAWRG